MKEEYDIGSGCSFFHFIEAVNEIDNESLRQTYLSQFFANVHQLVMEGKTSYEEIKIKVDEWCRRVTSNIKDVLKNAKFKMEDLIPWRKNLKDQKSFQRSKSSI